MSLTFQHADPRRTSYNISFFMTESSIELQLSQDGITHYIPERYWAELVEIINLADTEAKHFFRAVDDANAEATVDDDHDLRDHEPDDNAPF